MKKIVLIANSNMITDINHMISNDDLIVRFNIPSEKNIRNTGHRTDILFLANTADLMEDRLRSKDFNNFILSLKNTKIFFPYEDSLINKINPKFKTTKKILFMKYHKYQKNSQNQKYINYFSKKDISINILDSSYYWEVKSLAKIDYSAIVSTGLIALTYFLKNIYFANYKIYLVGFTFEGWSGHDWCKEKSYINKLIKDNKIIMV